MAMVEMNGMRVEELVEMVVSRLEAEASDRVSKRAPIERRWLEDIAQFEGEYTSEQHQALQTGDRSTAFVNQTRPKVVSLESKLFDLLFPTDDKNWAVDPTPVPELVNTKEKAAAEAERLTIEANATTDDVEAEGLAAQAQELATTAAEARAVLDQAKEHSRLMSDEIEDHLVECDWPAECRSLIHDACVLGTGILKGPLSRTERIRRNWLKNEKGEYELQFSDGGDRIVFQRISPWSLFPDSTALSFEDSECWYERHLLKSRDLRRLARMPNVNVQAIEELLEEGPQDTVPNYVRLMQAISNERVSPNDQRYLMWEYRGPLNREEMMALCAICGMEDDLDMDPDDLSPLFSVDCVVWFCQGRAVRFALNHLDSNDTVYSFFTLERNESRVWGVGVPWLMRHPQAIVNSAWRTMLDNAPLAAFPQTEVDLDVIEPALGDDYGLYPRKVWTRRADADPQKPGLKFHQIPSVQSDMAAIIEIATEFIDKETSVSVLASGEQGGATKTAGGMAILMNATNVVFRRIVKNFDDGIIEPSIERSYDYLMQFSPKDEIKGDYMVQARGSSVLLVREIQAQNLMLLAVQMLSHPDLGRFFKPLPLIRKLLQSMMIAESDVLKTQEEIDEEDAATEEGPPDPALMQMQLQAEIEQGKMELALMLAQIEQETAILKLATEKEIKLEDITARLEAVREQTASRLAAVREQAASRERLFAGEAALSTGGPQGGGYL